MSLLSKNKLEAELKRIGLTKKWFFEASCACPWGFVLRGSWDFVTRVIIKVTTLITPLRVLITLLTRSHDPPSKVLSMRCFSKGVLVSRQVFSGLGV